MNDGILLLLVRYFESEVDEIKKIRSRNLEYHYRHPDCGIDPALEWAECEMEIRELRASLPSVVVDVAEGVDNDLDDVDHLVEVFDEAIEALEELPF